MGYCSPRAASFGWDGGIHRVGLPYLCAAAILVALTGQAQAQTFSTGANFTTMTRNQTRTLTGFNYEPPDTMGAGGPNHFIEFDNGSFSIFSKNGGLVSQTNETTFWTNALGSDPGNLSDPRILYDPASQRWFAAMITTDQKNNNKILYARSNTSDPTQGFKGVSFTTSTGRFADFPTLGVDANGVYVGTNNFHGQTLASLALYSVPKADLIATTPSLARLMSFTGLSTGTYGFTFQPVVNFGPKQST